MGTKSDKAMQWIETTLFCCHVPSSMNIALNSNTGNGDSLAKNGKCIVEMDIAENESKWELPPVATATVALLSTYTLSTQHKQLYVQENHQTIVIQI